MKAYTTNVKKMNRAGRPFLPFRPVGVGEDKLRRGIHGIENRGIVFS